MCLSNVCLATIPKGSVFDGDRSGSDPYSNLSYEFRSEFFNIVPTQNWSQSEKHLHQPDFRKDEVGFLTNFPTF